MHPLRTALLAACCVLQAGAALIAEDTSPVDLSVLTKPGTPFVDGDSIFCLGDSITQFGGGPTGYVTLLHDAFANAGHPAVTVVNAGVSGNTVPNLQERLERDVLSKHPTLVFIYIGINDVWHHGGDLGAPKTAFEAGLHDIISRIQAQGAIVVLATPTVIGEKPHGGNPLDASLDIFAQSSRTIAKEMGVELCDLRKAFVDYENAHNPDGKEKGVLTADGVHMIRDGDRLLAEEAAKSLVLAIPRSAAMPMIRGVNFVDKTTVTIRFRTVPEAKGLVARYTVDGSEPTASSPIYSQPLELTATTTIKARSFRDGAPACPTLTCTCKKLVPRPADKAPPTVPGLAYSYYEGSFGFLPDFSTLTAASSGLVTAPTLSLRKRATNYALHFTGYIKIATPGMYMFRLTSDDGSRFLLGNTVLINNDGQHAMSTVQAQIGLEAGLHACTIDFFQSGGDQGLEFAWRTPDADSDQLVPESAFFTPAPAK